MSYNANCADVISEEALTKIVGKKDITKFHKLVDEAFDCEYEAIDYITYCGESYSVDAKKGKQFLDLVQKIKTKFHEETGLTLYIKHHDSENDGDIYDDVDGIFFEVGECYVPSPALQALRLKYGENVIERQFYVVEC